MFDEKKKIVTFSYDDGITQDQRFIKLLNKYGLKCTFNINSELLGQPGSLIRNDVTVAHVKPRAEEIAKIYAGHEVAVHTLTHPFLPNLEDDEIIRQVEQDRINLSELVGYEVVGMAYPCGGENNNDRVANIIKENTGVKYARTILSSHSFELQDNLYRFNPTVYHMNHNKMMELGEEFINLQPDSPKLFYIWGHTYELDSTDGWEQFEDFCKLISNREDIYYCTNKEAFGI